MATHAFNDSGSSTTFLLSIFLHFFYQHFPFPLGNPTHAVNDYYIPFIKISPLPLATQPTLSMITTFLLSKFDPPPPWQPMLSMIQVQILHSFIKIFTFILSTFPVAPLGNPTHAFNDYYIPFIKISPSLATQPVLPVIITFLLSNFPPPPSWQPMLSMIQVQVLHSFYQDLCIHFIKISSPLATQPMLSMITTFILSKFPPPLGNPTHALNDSCSSTTFLSSRFLHSFYQDFPPPPLATQPMLSMITTFLLSKFLPPLGNQTHAFNDYYIPFIKIPHPPPPLATHAFNDSCASTTFLLSRFLHSFDQNLTPPPTLGNLCFQ